MEIKKYIMGTAILILVLILGLSATNIFASGGQAYTSSNVQTTTQLSTQTSTQNNYANAGVDASTSSGNVQNAKLALVDFSYKLTPNKLKKGVPVRIEVDASTLGGCMRNVVIKDFGIRKSITAGNNIIEFTPDKTGTFWIACSMGMGPGSFEVVNADGTSDPSASVKTQTPPPSSGGSCSASGGGCGCMG